MTLRERIAKAAGTHPFVDDGSGRCAARPGGSGHWPVCGQWATNDVHTVEARKPAWVERMAANARDLTEWSPER